VDGPRGVHPFAAGAGYRQQRVWHIDQGLIATEAIREMMAACGDAPDRGGIPSAAAGLSPFLGCSSEAGSLQPSPTVAPQ
jgi:hypothetical protein